MPFSITCPKCESTVSAPEAMAGKKVRCKKCGEVFVARPVGDEEDDRPRPSKVARRDDDDEPIRRPSRRYEDDEDDDRRPARRSRANEDEDEDEPPRRASRRRADDDDEVDDRRPARRPRDDDAEDEPRPRGKRAPAGRRKKSGRPVLMYLLLGLGGLLLLCGGGVGFGVYYLFSGPSFRDFTAPDGSFTAAFPGTPNRTTRQRNTSRPGESREEIRYTAATQSGTYEVSMFEHGMARAGVPAREIGSERMLDMFADRFSVGINGVVTRKPNVTHQGRPAREFDVTIGGEQGVVRVFITSTHVFILTVSKKMEAPDPKLVAKFFDGFHITEPASSSATPVAHVEQRAYPFVDARVIAQDYLKLPTADGLHRGKPYRIRGVVRRFKADGTVVWLDGDQGILIEIAMTGDQERVRRFRIEQFAVISGTCEGVSGPPGPGVERTVRFSGGRVEQ